MLHTKFNVQQRPRGLHSVNYNLCVLKLLAEVQIDVATNMEIEVMIDDGFGG